MIDTRRRNTTSPYQPITKNAAVLATVAKSTTAIIQFNGDIMTDADKKTVAVDFDGVLCNQVGRDMGEPMPGAYAAMEALYDRGYAVVIHTYRATSEKGRELVEDWLDRFGIDYHRVTATKPNAAVFIDDRAVRHTDWQATMAQVDTILGYQDEE